MNIKLAKYSMWITALLINVIGMSTIYSVTRYSSDGIRNSFNNQMKFLIISIVFTLLVCRLPSRFWKILTPWAYMGTLILLTAVLVIGKEINGAQSWIQLPGLSIQPSEFLKFSLVIALAKVLSAKYQQNRLQDFLLVFFVSALPLLLILMQPDLGTAMTLIPMVIGVTYLSGYDLPHIGMLIALGSLGFILLIVSAIHEWEWIPIHTYQLGRIIRLFHQDELAPLLSLGHIPPQIIMWSTIALSVLSLIMASSWRKLIWVFLIVGHAYPLYQWSSQTEEHRIAVNEHFLKPFRAKRMIEEPQLIAAKYALANGNLTGQGWRQGEQTQYQRLPYAYSDLIFAAFTEEWGFVGALFLLGLYTLLVLSLIVMASKVEDKFCALSLSGIALMLMGQIFIHVGYTTGIIPMTGITMPFMSAGGTALFTTWVGIALAHSCASHGNEYQR